MDVRVVSYKTPTVLCPDKYSFLVLTELREDVAKNMGAAVPETA
jgi:hypothetical protein